MANIYITQPALTKARLSPEVAGNSLAVLAMLTWAMGFPAAEVLLQKGWNPLFTVSARLLVGLMLLYPMWIYLDGTRAIRSAPWGRGIVIGMVCFGTSAYLLLMAQSLTDPVLVAIISSSMPIIGTCIEVFLKERRLTLTFCLGLVATIIGGIVATGAEFQLTGTLGILAALVASVLFTFGSHITARTLPNLSVTGRTTVTFTGAVIFAVGAAGITQMAGYNILPTLPITGNDLTMLAIYAMLGLAISQAFWLAYVDRLGVALASFHVNIAPFYVMLFMLMLGASWNWPQAIGALIVGVGVIIAQRR